MKKSAVLCLLVVLGVFLLGACFPSAAPAQVEEPKDVPETGLGGELAGEAPTETPSAPPAAVTPAVIVPNNAAHLVRIGEYALPAPVNRLVWSLDGSVLGAMTNDSLFRIAVPSLTQLGSVQLQAPFILLDFSADGLTMAATSDWAAIHLMSAVDGSLIRTITPTSPFTDATFSPDGTTLVVNSTDTWAANLWDVQSGQMKQSLTGFETAAPVYSVFFSSNNRYVIWVARAHVQLTGINSGQMGIPFFHEDFVAAVALNAGGSILAVSTDGMLGENMVPFIKLWDPASGSELGLLQTPQMAQSLAFSPDDALLAAGPWIWDVQAQNQVFSLDDPAGISDSLFSPDGRTLAAVNRDGKLTLWQVAP
jgi:WD40 repeat protein